MSTLRTQFLQHVAQTSPSPLLIEVAKAEGVFLYTPTGKRYFDLISGVSVCNVGHSNVVVRDAIKAQVDSYMHTMVYGETVQRVQVELAVQLAKYLPEGLDSIYFLNSGAEAIEGALKLAKRVTGRGGMISMVGAYHGSTHGALSIQGGEEYKTAFRPLLPETKLIEYNNFIDLKQIDSTTACVVAEVVQGESGVRLPVSGYLEALQARCKEVGALLIIDEIQTGFGRTGELFASNKYRVKPDILCMAKALGGGLPLGAFAARKELMDSFTCDPVLGHISTFGGNPVCCAAGLASLEYIISENLVQRAEEAGALFESLLSDAPSVIEIRRSGLIMAVELGSTAKLLALMDKFLEVGVMSDWFLFCDTAFRISPPLTITDAEVREVSNIICEALASI